MKILTSPPIFDDATLCKHVTAKENAEILFKFLFLYEKHVVLAINIVFVQILITSLLSGTGLYVMKWVKYGQS